MADRPADELRLLDVDNNSSALVAEAAEVADGTLDKPTVRQTVWRVTKGLVPVVTIYALGFWRVASVSAWVLVPFFFCLSVVRDLLSDAGRIKRRRAQIAAAADEKDLITANVAELPSWVFFPDIHRAEWLNQVGLMPTGTRYWKAMVRLFADCTTMLCFRLSNRCGR
jgi:hypothetical protein